MTDRLNCWSGKLRKDLLKIVESPSDKRVVVFDFDFTLLKGDISEALFQCLIKKGKRNVAELRAAYPELFPTKEITNLWDYYLELIANREVFQDAIYDHLWITRALAGLSVREIEAETLSSFESEELEFLPETAQLLGEFLAGNFEVWIISGSNFYLVKALVEKKLNPLLQEQGFPAMPLERIIGLRLEEENGVVTDRVIDPYSSYKGKVDCLRQAGHESCFFVASDSPTDLPLFEAAEKKLWIQLCGPEKTEEIFYDPQDESWLRYPLSLKS